ncbi:MAG: phosphoribosylaminoimidazolesuccinocarboxamide synthase [Victivallales bacterium]|nr:phosphoribosylaminoimidazolesuccinocarboxamide synthase [Victivallales bacterium]MBR6470921.1 phosphoribosylaminoimidazolesuccinocarboxamide synthase [Victivallales bacterium]
MQYDQNHALLSTEIPELTAVRRGKVRDVYDLGDSILFVATDRISAFDCVMPNGIPGKGRVLAQVTLNWFKVLTGIKNHLITADVSKYPAVLQKYAADLEGRSMLVRKLNMLPVECIVRGYLTGSGWSSYQKTGKVCGIPLREGYQNASKLDEPIFTPTTKAETGHDEAISFEELSAQIGSKLADALRNASIALYNQAAEYALKRGIIIADTKFEFGTDENGDLILADEVLTPDSSRFWPVDSYQVGKNPPSLDKQFVRDWLDSVHFNHQPPAPELPPEVVQKTREKYEEALESLKVRG